MSDNLLALLGRFDRIGRAIETTLLVLVLSILILVAAGQIVLREFFDIGFIWANELQNLMVLWLAMIATVAACRDNRHIRIDALSHVLPKPFIRFSRVIVDLFAAVVCVIVAWQVYRYIQLEIEFEDTLLVDTPAWLIHSVVPVAFLLTAYRFVVSAIKKAVGLDVVDEKVQVL
jgi:TRAP-type C4-dicarboxylate transport system permease small subunit